MLVQFRDPSLSLWQSAIDEAIRNDNPGWTFRPSLAVADEAGATLRGVAAHCEALAAHLPIDHIHSLQPTFARLLHLPQSQLVDDQTARESSLFLSLAKAEADNDTVLIRELKAQTDFGNRDPRYLEAVAKYVQYFKLMRQPIPYVAPSHPDDGVEPLADNCKIALVGDWGTGQQPAKTVLQRIAQHNPDVVVHLGDIYYSGTKFEADNYFLKIFQEVFPNTHLGRGSKPRVLTMAGNHDMYAGGSGYYWLLRQIEQPASYFCLQNAYWRFVGVDTGFNDHDPFTVNSVATRIQDKELDWLKAQVDSAGEAKIVLLSHHPLFSAFDDIDKQAINVQLLTQVRELLPRITAWYWAHEHNQVIYKERFSINGETMKVAARLIGHGAFPIAIDELSAPKHPQIPFYSNVVLGNDGTCFNHGYALITLEGPNCTADYYECGPTTDTVSHREQLNSLP